MKLPIGFVNPLRRENEELKKQIQLIEKDLVKSRFEFNKLHTEKELTVKQIQSLEKEKTELKKMVDNLKMQIENIVEISNDLFETSQIPKTKRTLCQDIELFHKNIKSLISIDNSIIMKNEMLKELSESFDTLKGFELKPLIPKWNFDISFLSTFRKGIDKTELYRPDASFFAKSEGDSAMTSSPISNPPKF